MFGDTFLSKEELQYLTGAKWLVKQRKWLIDRGYSFEVRPDGSNVVLRAHIIKKLGGSNDVSRIRLSRPNIQALEEIMGKNK